MTAAEARSSAAATEAASLEATGSLGGEDLHVGDAPARQRHDARRDIDMGLGFRGVEFEGADVEVELVVGRRASAGE